MPAPKPVKRPSHRRSTAGRRSEDGEGGPQLGWGKVSVRRLLFVSEAPHSVSTASGTHDGAPCGLGPHSLLAPTPDGEIRTVTCVRRARAERMPVRPELGAASSEAPSAPQEGLPALLRGVEAEVQAGVANGRGRRRLWASGLAPPTGDPPALTRPRGHRSGSAQRRLRNTGPGVAQSHTGCEMLGCRGLCTCGQVTRRLGGRAARWPGSQVFPDALACSAHGADTPRLSSSRRAFLLQPGGAGCFPFPYLRLLKPHAFSPRSWGWSHVGHVARPVWGHGARVPPAPSPHPKAGSLEQVPGFLSSAPSPPLCSRITSGHGRRKGREGPARVGRGGKPASLS